VNFQKHLNVAKTSHAFDITLYWEIIITCLFRGWTIPVIKCLYPSTVS